MLLLVFSSLIAQAMAFPNQAVIRFDCSQGQNVMWWGCGSYGICRDGQYSQVDCANGTVYSPQGQQCTDRRNAGYPCNVEPDCSQWPDSPGHRTPLNPNGNAGSDNASGPCTFYYTCSYGRLLGIQSCPREQVYDEQQQRCSDASDIPPPCGNGPQRTEEPRQGTFSQDGGQGQIGQGQGQNPNPVGGGQGSGPRNSNQNQNQQEAWQGQGQYRFYK